MVFKRIYEFVYDKYFKKEDEVQRSFRINSKEHFPCSNLVKTTKYTPYNFVFKNLYEQLSIPSNFYFVIIAILQSTPQISSTHGYPVVLLPFVIVLLFSALKDAYEDYLRYLSDNQLNNNMVQIVNLQGSSEQTKSSPNVDINEMDRYEFVKGALKDKVLINKYWKDLKVGEYVFLQNKDIAPADLVVLATSEDHGYAFVDASSLDGETNIKKKESIYEIYNYLGSEFQTVITEVQRLVGEFHCDGANKNLMNFEGNLKYKFSKLLHPIPLGTELLSLISTYKSRLSQRNSFLLGETRNSIEKNEPKFYSSYSLEEEKESSIHKSSSLDEQLQPSHITTHMKLKNESRQDSILEFQKNENFKQVQVNLTNLLLRGCKLINTQWIVGFVVYTGHDTKIYKNISKAPYKVSNLQRKMMITTLLVVLLQACLCLFTSIYNVYMHSRKYYDKYAYLSFTSDESLTYVFFITFLSWVALTANFVPISAIVTLNMVKLVQGLFIQLDNSMYCSELKIRAVARNTMLNEELGQVKYLFSDKTGTLTCNKMEFRKFSVMGHSYGKGYSDVIKFVYAKKGIQLESEEISMNKTLNDHVNLVDDTLFEELKDHNHPRHEYLVDFFMHLAINNWALPDSADENTYICSSPDELCFVNAADFCGFKLLNRNSNFVVIQVFEEIYKIKIVAQADFDYKRKCSTTIVAFYKDVKKNFASTNLLDPNLSLSRSLPSKRDFNQVKKKKEVKSVSEELMKEDLSKYRFVLYCKGGDNIIIPKLKEITEVDKLTLKNMKKYSVAGFRTLMFGKRELKQEEFTEWLKEYNEIKKTLERREEKLTNFVAKLENELVLQGVTGIEDKLQEGVSECIESLLIAGIKVWMLTGDNLETSINIGIATNLINLFSDRIMLDSNTVGTQDIKELMSKNIKRIDNEKSKSKHRCLIVDSISMEKILLEENAELFLEMIKRVHSVLCCRMTPYLKGAVVSFVKSKIKKITLAIGDGGNDCNMIQIAHVGVGIKGKEGSQAFNASDFGIGQFRFLGPLILHHGRCCYRRSSKCISYMFYKNVILIIPLFYYGYISFFSGQKIYYSLFVAIYNVVFTCLPVLVLGVIDQDYNKELSLKYPHIYQLGQDNYYFNVVNFTCWIINAIFHSGVIFAMMTLGFADFLTLAFKNGVTPDSPTVGIVLLSCVFMTVSLKLILETWYYTRFTSLSHLISIFLFLVTVSAFSTSPTFSGGSIGSAFVLFTSYRFWVILIATVMMALYRDYFYKVFIYSFSPHYYHHIQRVEYLKLDQIHQFA